MFNNQLRTSSLTLSNSLCECAAKVRFSFHMPLAPLARYPLPPAYQAKSRNPLKPLLFPSLNIPPLPQLLVRYSVQHSSIVPTSSRVFPFNILPLPRLLVGYFVQYPSITPTSSRVLRSISFHYPYNHLLFLSKICSSAKFSLPLHHYFNILPL